MKDCFKFIGILFVGLLTVIILYPFLHESGHFMVAVLVGAKAANFKLFPLPYMICETSTLNRIDIISIGLAGMFVPAIISIMLRPRSFFIWYANLIIRCICLLSFAISFVAIILYNFGVEVINEDIVKVINIWKDGVYFLALLMIISVIATIYSVIKDKPLNRIMSYFKISI